MMDDALLQEILEEIDNMTSEEYWKLWNESQKLPDFPGDTNDDNI
jgi:hypothetical protein